MNKRYETKKIMVGNVQIGNQDKIVIQSMTNTKTKDVNSTVKQILELEKAGCEIIRVAVLDQEDAKAIKEIKKQIHIPLVSDIHFDHKLALSCIENGVDKVRINPGNIGSKENVKQVVDACKFHNIPIRIGVNSGSLDKKILDKYHKPCAEAIIESCLEHVSILEDLKFDNIILSLKASNLRLTVDSYLAAAKKFNYPLHLGVTEAGTLFSSTVKSSAALGILINEKIGDTIRISITDDPIQEIKVCNELLKNFDLVQKPKLISCPTCGRIQYDMIPIAKEIEDYLLTKNGKITVAIMGCAVNGPGEAKEADIGIAGGKNEAILFKKGEIIRKIKQEEAVKVLKSEIDLLLK